MTQTRHNKTVAIIGGGISGLFCGYFLSKKGYTVCVFEKEPCVGGLLSTITIRENVYVDKLYRHIFYQDKALISFIEQVGLTGEIAWRDNLSSIIINKKNYSINSVTDLFKIKDIRFSDAYKLLYFVLRMLLMRNGQALDTINVAQLFKRYCGETSWEHLYSPLMRAKFGDTAGEISGAWLHDKIRQRIKCRTPNKGEKLAVFINSNKVLTDYLANAIMKKGGNIYTDSLFDRMDVNNGHISNVYINNIKYSFDHVVVTIPIPEFIKRLPAHLISRYDSFAMMDQMEYAHSLCVLLRLSKPLSKYYFTVLADPDGPFSTIIEQTNIVDAGHYNDEHIVYLGKYIFSKEQLYKKTDDEIIERYFQYLRELFPHMDKKDIVGYHVSRYPYAQPLFKKNYTNHKIDFTTGIEGLFILNLIQLFPMSRSVNSSLLLAQQFTTHHF